MAITPEQVVLAGEKALQRGRFPGPSRALSKGAAVAQRWPQGCCAAFKIDRLGFV